MRSAGIPPPISRSCSQRWVSRYSVKMMTRASDQVPGLTIGSSHARNARQLRVRAVLRLPGPRAEALQEVTLMLAERRGDPADGGEHLGLAMAVRRVVLGGFSSRSISGLSIRVPAAPPSVPALPRRAGTRRRRRAVIVFRWVSTVSANAFGQENRRFFSSVVTKSAAVRCCVSPGGLPAAVRVLGQHPVRLALLGGVVRPPGSW